MHEEVTTFSREILGALGLFDPIITHEIKTLQANLSDQNRLISFFMTSQFILPYQNALLTRWGRWKEAQCLPHGGQCLICGQTAKSENSLAKSYAHKCASASCVKV